MTYAQRMIETNPSPTSFEVAALAACIEVWFSCEQVCVACADACLGEQDTQMLTRCIRLDLDCADICATTGRMLSRQTAFAAQLARAVLETCATACRRCGDECAQHAQHGMQHCAVCAETCRRCEQACQALITAAA